MIGGVLPDLDSDSSKPVQIFFKILSIFLPLLVLLVVPEKLPILHMLGIWLVATFILKLLFTIFFLKMTTHRGIFHTIPMGLLFSQLLILLFHYIFMFDLLFSTIAGVFLFFGFVIHLILDELVSLNILGLKVKHSFGTALKMYDLNNIYGTLVLYIAVITLYFLMPLSNDIYTDIFELFKDIKFI